MATGGVEGEDLPSIGKGPTRTRTSGVNERLSRNRLEKTIGMLTCDMHAFPPPTRQTASLLGKAASPSECFLRGKAARRFKNQDSPTSHLERSAAFARCLAAAGKCESAARAMAKVERAYPGDHTVAFLSSTELAQLAMAGTCGWQHADASFESLHARFQPTADSMRNAALVKTQLSMFEEAEKLFARSISIR